MRPIISLIIYPISLCAYVISVAFWLVAKKKDSRFFYLAVVGGLLLARQQIKTTTPIAETNKAATIPPVREKNDPTAERATNQVSHANQSPNISSVERDTNISFGAGTGATKQKK